MSKILDYLRIVLVVCLVIVGGIFVKSIIPTTPPVVKEPTTSAVTSTVTETKVPEPSPTKEVKAENSPTPTQPTKVDNSSAQTVASNTFTNVDMIILVDSSASMKKANPQKLYIKAIKMLIAKTSMFGSQIGIMQFSDKVDETFRFSRINGKKDKDKIIAAADKINPIGQWTDIGNALSEASSVLSSSHDPKNKPIIVLITDGKNSFPENSPASGESDKKQAESLKLCKEKGYPIYTIGLDYVEKADTVRLTAISDSTMAKNYLAKSPTDLWGFLSDMFVHGLNSLPKTEDVPLASGNGTSEFLVTSDSVAELNIEITSPVTLGKRLADPTGNNISIPSEDSGIYSFDFEGASIIKITKPLSDAKNPWKLILTDNSKSLASVKVSYLYNYNFSFKVDVDKKEYKTGDTVNADAYFHVDGKKLADAGLLQGINANMVITDSTGKEITSVPMNPEAGSFKGTYKVDSEGSYKLYVSAKGSYFAPQSQAVEFTVVKGVAKSSEKTTVPETTKNAEPEKEPTTNGYTMWIILGALAIVILLAIAGIFILPILTPGVAVPGRLQIQSKNADGRSGRPSYIPFKDYPTGKATLTSLLERIDEKYNDTDKILFKGIKGDKIKLINSSRYKIEVKGKTVKSCVLDINDEVAIKVSSAERTVFVKYIAD